jgi:hypothetical protein
MSNSILENTDILPGYVNCQLCGNSAIQLFKDKTAPRYGMTVSGYGGKIPTVYRIKFNDNRIRRVYVMQYGNSGSAYVILGGYLAFLNSDIEHDLMKLEG